MRLPEFLVIAGQAWSVETGPIVEAELAAEGNLGTADFVTHKIKVRLKDRTRQAAWETLLHEIGHVVLHNAGLEPIVFAGDKEQQAKGEEAVNTAFSAGLYQVLTDNGLWRGR